MHARLLRSRSSICDWRRSPPHAAEASVSLLTPRSGRPNKGDPVATVRATTETLCEGCYGSTRQPCHTQYKRVLGCGTSSELALPGSLNRLRVPMRRNVTRVGSRACRKEASRKRDVSGEDVESGAICKGKGPKGVPNGHDHPFMGSCPFGTPFGPLPPQMAPFPTSSPETSRFRDASLLPAVTRLGSRYGALGPLIG